jgi:hypothetical protein
MQAGVDPKTAAAVVTLIASIIALITAILSLANTQAKDATTPQAKRAVYRKVLGWVETGLWAAGMPATWLAGPDLTLGLWLAAYCLGVGLFLTGHDSRRLRLEIFQLVLSAQAVVILLALASDSHLLALIGRLQGLIDRLVNAL